MNDRLYIVKTIKESAKVRLVKAANVSQVAKHLAADLFIIEAADPMDVAKAFAEQGNIAVETPKNGGTE